ncbi:unnamed protein product [Meloidogyne enterolobii]|uniref:Uncharacterized protein n=1 Tax=Meloidogyne enterolobii TaxID=390850 RepID=A0ACB0YE25_MELEN
MSLITVYYRGLTYQRIIYRDGYNIWELMCRFIFKVFRIEVGQGFTQFSVCGLWLRIFRIYAQFFGILRRYIEEILPPGIPNFSKFSPAALM